MAVCHDCKGRKDDVKIRQSDYLLCDNCESIRRNVKSNAHVKKPQDTTSSAAKPVPGTTESSPRTNKIQDLLSPSRLFSRLSPKEADCIDCIDTCTFPKDQGKTQECSLCSRLYHYTCTGITRKQNSWFCPLCKSSSRNVADMKSTIQQLTSQVQKQDLYIKQQDAKMKKQEILNSALAKMTDSLQTQIRTLKEEFISSKGSHTKSVSQSAQTESNSISNDTKTTNTQDNTSMHPNSSLLIGDSILRDIKEKGLKNTSVKCHRGAKVDKIRSVLTSTKVEALDKIIMHVGTNNCTNDKDMEMGVQNFESMIDDLNTRAPHTIKVISSFCTVCA